MQAAVFESYQGPLKIQSVADPTPSADSAIIKVEACGICRSDWHGWMGHDSDVHLPHVPGHELSGVVVDVGLAVTGWKPGTRVTVPFCCGCGTCRQCSDNCQHICDNYSQPGFTQWGAFAEFVEIQHADVNLVALPESIDFVTAASLGCRFATSFRGVVHQAKVTSSDTVAIHGCGGVGLSAVMISAALGATVIAIDIDPLKLQFAKQCGAAYTIDAMNHVDVVEQILELSVGGASVSIDALGSQQTCFNSIACLQKRGRHVQIGLTLGNDTNPRIPMSAVIGKELKIYGSHGMPAGHYEQMLKMVIDGQLNPEILIGDRVTLEQACRILPAMNQFPTTGVTVINRFNSSETAT